MRSVLRPALAALASVAAVVPLLVAGPLTPGQAGTYGTGKVTKVIDGDTVVVDHRAVVRLIGIDTPEHGQCGYGAATRALRRLVGGKQVVLRSDTGRSGLRGRPERRVLVRSGGKLVDSTTSMLERGLGVWMPRKGEVTNSKAHHRAADLARVLAGTRLDAIISTQYARTRQTAAPAAGQAGLEPTIISGGGSVTAHAAEIARAIDALPPGSAVLVVGHSNTLAPIIAALGGPKLSELCDLEYSSLLLLERASRDAAWRFMRVKYGAPDPAGADQCNATGESMRQGG